MCEMREVSMSVINVACACELSTLRLSPFVMVLRVLIHQSSMSFLKTACVLFVETVCYCYS